jgi:D-alanyl-lipoteichoic acid acyltransferase DltB (MBOAT superfamily)
LPLKTRWIWLLVSSVFFYLFSNVANGIYLAITVITTYCGGVILYRLSGKESGIKFVQKKKKITLVSIILLNIGILFVFKYYNFFAYNLTNLLGINFSLNLPSLALPLGISFYTFQSLGYLLDVYWGTAKPQNNIGKLGLFVGFFPTVMQGPISRYNDLMPQLEQGHRFNYENAVYGIQRVAWGVFKKVVIADRLGVFVAEAYTMASGQSGGALAIATILFAFQLYTDFSGYMDMMIGLSQMLGIKLKENFERPFFARSISEYWRKWHITLGTWFKDYLFYPLLKSNAMQSLTKIFSKKIKKRLAKKITTCIAMFILWTIIGLWHGASMSFVIGSGILHWFYIVVGETIGVWCRNKLQKMHVNTENIIFQFFRQVRTFLLVCVGFVFLEPRRQQMPF